MQARNNEEQLPLIKKHMKIEIKSIFGNVLFVYEKENTTIKDAVEQAVKENANLRYANLRYANLYNANLESANLENANLESANLENANLENANLRYANLYNANLRYANLRYANLRYANLYNANLYNANLYGANLESANLESANLESVIKMPIHCKWSHGITNGNLIHIGCEKRTIDEWDKFFASDDVISTERNTKEFNQIEAVYKAYKAYLTTLNNEEN